jgi:predicted amidohydrolase
VIHSEKRLKVAAYQAPLLPAGSTALALSLIRERVEWCEAEGVEILCCPEGVLGGLADYAPRPLDFSLDVASGQLHTTLAPLASDRVTTIVGFTERGSRGRLFNSAAVLHRGSVLGVYRKLYPAIHASVYAAGDQLPVFTVGDLTFGIVICLDSTYSEPARIMAAKGAAALFVPTNNGMPPTRGGTELPAEARNKDVARAVENGVSVVRADVVGRTGDLVSYGSSGIVGPSGTVLGTAQSLEAGLVVADIKTAPREPRPGWDASRNPAVASEYAQLVARAFATTTHSTDASTSA